MLLGRNLGLQRLRSQVLVLGRLESGERHEDAGQGAEEIGLHWRRTIGLWASLAFRGPEAAFRNVVSTSCHVAGQQAEKKALRSPVCQKEWGKKNTYSVIPKFRHDCLKGSFVFLQ